MKLVDRLGRYTGKALSERTDPDFAEAVQEAIDILEKFYSQVEISHVEYDDAQMGREK